MPYKHAYLWMTATIALAVVAFWPSYFGRIGDAEWTFHFHAATAMLWMFLLVGQSWSAHRKSYLPLHRTLGKASLALFPVFLAASFLIIWSMAVKTGAGEGFIYPFHGEGLGAYDMLGTAAFAYFYYEAIRHRRKVHIHARFLIGTAFILLGPALGRLVPIALFGITGGSWGIPVTFAAGLWLVQILVTLLALFLMRAAPLPGKRPMLVVGVAVLAQAVVFQIGTSIDAWRNAFIAIGSLSAAVIGIMGFVAGAVIAWQAWEAGKAASPGSKEAVAATAG